MSFKARVQKPLNVACWIQGRSGAAAEERSEEEWHSAEEIGIDANVVRARYENGWSLQNALYTPLIMQTVRRKVLKIDIETGKILREYASIGQAAKDVGVDRSSISRCCAGKSKQSAGFLWEYANKENE